MNANLTAIEAEYIMGTVESWKDGTRLIRRQREYDALTEWMSAWPDQYPADLYERHKLAVRILDGNEPDPRSGVQSGREKLGE